MILEKLSKFWTAFLRIKGRMPGKVIYPAVIMKKFIYIKLKDIS